MKVWSLYLVFICIFLTACIKATPEKNTSEQNILSQLGDISVAKGDFTMAEKFYLKALSEKPGDLGIMKKLAHSYSEQGKLNSAIELYQKVIDKNPQENEALRRQANLYLRTGALSKSINRYHRAISVKPNDSKSYNNLGYLLGLADHHEVAMRCYINEKNQTKSLSRQNNLAISHALLGESREALDILYSVNTNENHFSRIIESNIVAIENYQKQAAALPSKDDKARGELLAQLREQLNPQTTVTALTRLSLDEAVAACGNYDDAFSLELGGSVA